MSKQINFNLMHYKSKAEKAMLLFSFWIIWFNCAKKQTESLTEHIGLSDGEPNIHLVKVAE